MRKLILSATMLLLASTGLAQGVATDAEALEPELRRYSVELIVFAYAEDVATGSELFLPEVIEVEPAADLDAEPWPLEGPVPDDSMPSDSDGDEPAGSDEPDAAAASATDAVLFNENGERINEDGELIDENGQLIGEFDPYVVVMFGEDELTMRDTWDRLDRLDAYAPLLHVGWAQPALGEEEAQPITIDEFGVPVDGLEGQFTLYLSRYLHLVVNLDLLAERGDGVDVDGVDADAGRDLSYEETVALYGRSEGLRSTARLGGRDPAADDIEGLAPAPVLKVLPLRYTIDENRIVNSGERRYFDHPKFGVVAKVERVEMPETPEEDDTDILLPVGGQ